jgi:hypothetical protein
LQYFLPELKALTRSTMNKFTFTSSNYAAALRETNSVIMILIGCGIGNDYVDNNDNHVRDVK